MLFNKILINWFGLLYLQNPKPLSFFSKKGVARIFKNIIIEYIINNIYMSLESIIEVINPKYQSFLNNLLEKFKLNDNELYKLIKYDIKDIQENLKEDNNTILDIIIDNFLFCLEQINDHNNDYFIYQKERIEKKNGKSYKNKLPKLGYKTLLKRVLEFGDKKLSLEMYQFILELITLLTVNTDGKISFNKEFEEYVKENFDENKNYGKNIQS